MSGPLPRGACDCHCHVFGPAARFPYAEPRSYTPEDAPLKAYLALLDRLGFDRGVLVQPSAYGRDNRAMLDALTHVRTRLRGVAVGGTELNASTLRDWHAAGVRGLRANEFRRDGTPYYQNGVTLKEIHPLSPAIADLGWHLQLWIDTRDLPDLLPALANITVPVVVDHMGRMEHRHGTNNPGFQALLRGVGEGRLWSKLSGTYRLRAPAPNSEEARPCQDALVAANPANLVWGTDWPHPRPEGPVPDAARLLNVFRTWTTSTNQQAILVDNPARLYDFCKADVSDPLQSPACRGDWRRRGDACRPVPQRSGGLPTRPGLLPPRDRAYAIPLQSCLARATPRPAPPDARSAARTKAGNARSARPAHRLPPAGSFSRARGAERIGWSTDPAGRRRANPRRGKIHRRVARASAITSCAAACRA